MASTHQSSPRPALGAVSPRPGALPRRKVGLAFGAALWAVLTIAGVTKMKHYGLTPTAAATDAKSDWPGGASIAPAIGRPTLVVFLHPLCPCSRASLEELAELLADKSGRIKPIFVFVEPSLFGEDPSTNRLWKLATSIPDASIVVDPTDALTHQFGALSSGQAFLYDETGHLRFSGGVTIARGHRGDNPGIAAILAALSHDHPASAPQAVVHTPVFGCSLE